MPPICVLPSAACTVNTVSPTANSVPLNVKSIWSSNSPFVPASTTLVLVKSSTFKLATVACPSTSIVPLTVALPVMLVESSSSTVPVPLVPISISAFELLVEILLPLIVMPSKFKVVPALIAPLIVKSPVKSRSFSILVITI